VPNAPDNAPNFDDFLTVSEAAAFLGVSVSTLRNWDRSGKVKARRHPVNGYRLYDRDHLVTLIRKLNTEHGEGDSGR